MVSITLHARPDGTRWSLDGQPLPCNPCTLSESRGAKQVARATLAGFVAQTVDLDFASPGNVEVTLVRVPEEKPAARPQATKRKAPGKDLTLSTEDPYPPTR
jgi:hypothetical protein